MGFPSRGVAVVANVRGNAADLDMCEATVGTCL